MTLRLVSMPRGSVPLDLIKQHASIDGSYDDALIDVDLASAVEVVERGAGVGFFGATWEWTADAFPDGDIELDFGPIFSVTSIIYIDADSAEQTLSSGAYTFDGAPNLGAISVVDSWPETAEQANAVRVLFVAGRGIIPAPISRAVRMMMATGYDDRENGGTLTGGAQQLVAQYRRVWF